jgi:hypothetical protein
MTRQYFQRQILGLYCPILNPWGQRQSESATFVIYQHLSRGGYRRGAEQLS